MAEAETEHKKLEPSSTLEEIAPCKLKLQIEVTADKVTERIQEKYRDLNQSMALPGFRKGHSPRNLLERKFGKAVLEELKGELLHDSFEEVRETKNIEPMGEPDIDAEKITVVEGQPFRYEVTLEVRPKIDLKPYKGKKVTRPKIEVAEADVDRVMEGFRESKAEWLPAADGARQGDQIIGDLTFIVEDKEIGKEENATLILDDSLRLYGVPLKDFATSASGKRPGECVNYALDLPEDFRLPEAAGKRGLLRVDLKSVKRKNLPELTEAFAKTFDLDTVEELREQIAKQVRREKEAEARRNMIDRLLDELLAENDFPLPEGAVKCVTEEALKRMQIELALRGVPREECENLVKENTQVSHDAMVKSLRIHFVLEHIAQKERLFVTEEQIEERIGQMAAQHGVWPHEMSTYLEERELLMQLRRQMREDAVREFLLSQAVIEDEFAGAPLPQPQEYGAGDAT